MRKVLVLLVAPALVGAVAGLIFAGPSHMTGIGVGEACADHGGVQNTVGNPPVDGFAWCNKDGKFFHWVDGTLQNRERHPLTWAVVGAFLALLTVALFTTKTKRGRRLMERLGAPRPHRRQPSPSAA
jgi:hypothetical protein